MSAQGHWWPQRLHHCICLVLDCRLNRRVLACLQSRHFLSQLTGLRTRCLELLDNPPELSPDFVLHCLIGTSTRAAVLRPLGSRATAVQQRCPHLHPLQLLLLFSGKERRLRALMWPHLPLISLIWRAYSSLRRSERRRVPQRLARLLASHPFDESPQPLHPHRNRPPRGSRGNSPRSLRDILDGPVVLGTCHRSPITHHCQARSRLCQLSVLSRRRLAG